MNKIRRVNIYFIIIMIIEVIAPYFLFPVYELLGVENIGLMLVLNHIMIFLVPAAIYLVVTKSPIKETLKLNKIHWKDALIMVAIGALAYPTSIFFSLITSLFFKNNISEVVGNLMSMPFILTLLVVAVTPAITEEVTVRGIILNGYQNCSRYKTALITGLIFGMLHLDGQQFLYTTVLGFVLGMVVSVTNSIFAGCITHFTMNGLSLGIQYLLFDFIESMGMSMQQEAGLAEMGTAALIFSFVFYGIIAIAGGAAIWSLIKYVERENIKRGVILPEKSRGENINTQKIFDYTTIAMILVYSIIMVLTF